MEPLDSLKSQRAYIKDLLENYKVVQEVIPMLKERLEELDWEIDALANRPEEANETPLDDMQNYFEMSNRRMIDIIPPMPHYDQNSIETWVFANTSGSASIFEHVTRVGDLGTPSAKAYSERYVKLYLEMQTVHNRPDVVRLQLEKLDDLRILVRFATAAVALPTMKAGVKSRSEAALAMRNLVDGLQGVLFEKARKWPKENMTWEEMSERLSKDTNNDYEKQELTNQECKRKARLLEYELNEDFQQLDTKGVKDLKLQESLEPSPTPESENAKVPESVKQYGRKRELLPAASTSLSSTVVPTSQAVQARSVDSVFLAQLTRHAGISLPGCKRVGVPGKHIYSFSSWDCRECDAIKKHDRRGLRQVDA